MEKKALTCDLCLGLEDPSCVYACPHDAAIRIEPKRFFALQLHSAKEVTANDT